MSRETLLRLAASAPPLPEGDLKLWDDCEKRTEEAAKREETCDDGTKEKRLSAVEILAKHAPLPAGVDVKAVFARATHAGRPYRDEPFPKTPAAFAKMAREHNERVLAEAGYGVNALGNVTMGQGCAVVGCKRGRGAVGMDKMLRVMQQQVSRARR